MIKDSLADARVRMGKALEDFRRELAGLRTGRASASLLDHIKVEYYGAPAPLNQVATLAVPDHSLLTIQPWDPSLLPLIEKAIRSSDLGLNPVNDGKILRVPIPPLTEERRKELVRHLHRVLENHCTAVRSIRRDANEELKKLLKEKKIGEDDEKRALDEVQKITDEFIEKLEAQGKSKEKEILEIR